MQERGADDAGVEEEAAEGVGVEAEFDEVVGHVLGEGGHVLRGVDAVEEDVEGEEEGGGVAGEGV